MMLAPTTVTSLLLLRRFNKSVSSKTCRAALLLIHQNSSSSFSSSRFGSGTFILHQQQANNHLHTTTTSSSSSSKFGTFILQTYEPSVGNNSDGDSDREDDIKMFMLSSSGSSDGTGGEEEDKDDDLQKKKKMFKLDEDLGFSALYKDFQLQDSLRMVGSCNGIICLHDPKVDYPLRDIYLWNPATRQFRILPESIHIQEKQRSYEGEALHDFVGFGLDVETKDYKVLRITPFVPDSYRGYGCMCRVQVYSLSTDSWRLLDDGIVSLPVSPTQDLFGNRQGTYLNGSCFFLGKKPINHNGIRDLMLLSFDFTKEIFTIRPLPEKCRTMHKPVLKYWDAEEFDLLTSPHIVYLFSQANKFTAAYRTPRIDFAGGYVFTTPQIDLKGGYWYYDMWVLSKQIESGRVVVYEDVEEAKLWTKLHEFRIKTESKHPCPEPRCVSNDGEFALISIFSKPSQDVYRMRKNKKLMLFNLVTGKAIEDFTIGDRDCRAAYVYKESQVSIMGENVLLRWQLPSHGTTYKLNLAAPVIDSCRYFGIGLCLTSDTGGCIGVRSLNIDKVDAEDREAAAMLEAIKWAKELELSSIIIESNSKNMVSFFMEDVDDNNSTYRSKKKNSTYWSSESLQLLRQAKLLLNSSEISISFQYCSRSCNYVADIAAKLGRGKKTWSYKDWTANFPGEVVMSLSKDLGIETVLDSK